MSQETHLIIAVASCQPNKPIVWWKPNGEGYTTNLHKAGRFSEEDAIPRESDRSIAIPESFAKRILIESDTVGEYLYTSTAAQILVGLLQNLTEKRRAVPA